MSSLLDELGIDPYEFTWYNLAACREVDTEWFYDKYESDPVLANNVDQMCFNCPVMKECAMRALENKEEGVWGGIYWSNTGKPDPARNKHKTQEDWEYIGDKLGL